MAVDSNPQSFIHGSKLSRKAANDPALAAALDYYAVWKTASLKIAGRNQADVERLTSYLNQYKDAVESIFDRRENSAQEVLQPSILEEFLEYLFCTAPAELGSDLLRRPASGFIGLVFNPKSLKTLLTAPEYTIRKKDHDFVIGASVHLTVGTEGSSETVQDSLVVPAIAIECKRYLERNMLDECAGTAEKIKRATPYCKYFVVAEYLKMDDASPEMSLIDEIYILRKQKNSERSGKRFTANPIDGALVWDLYSQCLEHLKRVWWDPTSALTTGKVFNLPR